MGVSQTQKNQGDSETHWRVTLVTTSGSRVMSEAWVEAVARLLLVVALHRQRPQRLLVVRLAGVRGVAGGAGRVDAAMESVVM